MSGIRLSLLSALLGLTLLFTVACSGGNETPTELSDFGIYLEDTGELVISGEHIAAYYLNGGLYGADDDSHAIELTAEGIEQWNSFRKFDGKLLTESLYNRRFVVKIGHKEMYGGTFSSMISSAIYTDVVILDSVMTLDEEHNRIHIISAYPSADYSTKEDPRNTPEIIAFMEKHGLLK